MSSAEPQTPVAPAVPFEAANQLEQLLEATVNNKMSLDVFLNQFINMNVLVLLSQDPGAQAQLQQLSPVTVTKDNGKNMIVVFTAPQRAKQFLDNAPQFQHAIPLHVGLIIHTINSDLGIWVNPGWNVGFEWDAAGIQDVKTKVDWSKAPWMQTAAPVPQPTPDQLA